MEVTNIYPGGPEHGWQLVLVHPDGSKSFRECTYDYFRHDLTRVRARTWKQRQAMLETEVATTYEADLSPVRRFLADNPDVQIARPRRVWIDLETDPTVGFQNKAAMRIIVACAVGEDGREHTSVLEDWSDDAERRLLTEFFGFLTDYDQVCAWNGGSSYGEDGFDFPVLRARLDRYWPGYSRNTKRWLWLDHLKAYRKLHLMFAESGEERSSYSLDNVAQFVLGEGKHEYNVRDTLDDWRAGGARRDRLVSYCQQDTRLLPRIEAKTGVLDLAYQVAKLCGVLHDTSGLHATQFVDGFLLRLAGQRSIRLPTKRPDPPESTRKKNFAGAFVFEVNARGIERDVFSVDFGSLYPNVAIMLNASHETKGKIGSVSPATGVQFAQQPPGILTEALQELGKLKKQWKSEYKKYADGSQEYLRAKQVHDAVKSVVNSFYGYIGSQYARLYDKDIAESITQTGQFLIKSVAKETEKFGLTIVQGDTDSLYLRGGDEIEIRSFLDYCNCHLIPGIAVAHRCERPPPVLEFDKHYERLIVVSKKKYLGKYVGTDEYDTKGLEWRRGDASPLARRLQQAISELLMAGREDPEDFPLTIIEYRNRILHDPLDLKEVVLSESLGKDLHEYDTVSPAVTAARCMQARGEDVRKGTKIRYVVLDGSVSPVVAIPAADYTGELDRYHLWETQTYPPTQRLLEAAFPDYDWLQFAKVRPVVSPRGRTYIRREGAGQQRLPGL